MKPVNRIRTLVCKYKEFIRGRNPSFFYYLTGAYNGGENRFPDKKRAKRDLDKLYDELRDLIGNEI